MINFRVRDLNKMVAQLRERGITVELDSELYPNGRFARLSDPEGNPIQLWQPGGKDPGCGQRAQSNVVVFVHPLTCLLRRQSAR